jgi:hypothetical protein
MRHPNDSRAGWQGVGRSRSSSRLQQQGQMDRLRAQKPRGIKGIQSAQPTGRSGGGNGGGGSGNRQCDRRAVSASSARTHNGRGVRGGRGQNRQATENQSRRSRPRRGYNQQSSADAHPHEVPLSEWEDDEDGHIFNS